MTKRDLLFIWLILGLMLVASAILIMRDNKQETVPINQTHLEQLDIQTDNPQQAGKNIAPGT